MMRRLCVAGLLALGLAGCDQLPEGLAGLSSLAAAPDATGQGIRTLSLLGGDVRVRGPQAYCVDQGASRARDGFAVLAGCALLSEGAAVMPGIDGLITVQFGASDTATITGNEGGFASFIASDAGRALLAGNGEGTSVERVTVVEDRGGVLVWFEDGSGPAVAGTRGPQWRGFLDIKGRLVTVSVMSLARNPMTRSQGERLLVVTMAELFEVNAPEAVEPEDGT